ncbi:MAG: Asp23/Gls24 family envelope stress response protein [Clostridia bacterium]|nr:Asp23/Gls24 family envelope stress response protein [Clostridia bacterium]
MKVVAKTDKNGKVVYSTAILSSIVRYATDEVKGVVPYGSESKSGKRNSQGTKIETVGDFIYIDVYVRVFDNVKVKDVSHSVQESIKNTVESMTEFKVKDINVHIVDVEFLPNKHPKVDIGLKLTIPDGDEDEDSHREEN